MKDEQIQHQDQEFQQVLWDSWRMSRKVWFQRDCLSISDNHYHLQVVMSLPRLALPKTNDGLSDIKFLLL